MKETVSFVLVTFGERYIHQCTPAERLSKFEALLKAFTGMFMII